MEPSQRKDGALSAEIVSSVKDRLWEETTSGALKTLGKLQEAWYDDSDAVFYTRERERFEKYIPPFQYGLAATAFLFLNFRVTGSARFQQWRKGIGNRFRSQYIHKQAPRTSIEQPPPSSGILENERRKRVEKAMKSMRFLTDTLISIMFGTTGTLFMLQAITDKHLRTDFETAPLLAGRSLLADEMCSGMLDHHQSDPNVRWVLEDNFEKKGDNESEKVDPFLATISMFIKNCQKRADHEERLRKEQRGFHSGKGLVLIPHTGVQ